MDFRHHVDGGNVNFRPVEAECDRRRLQFRAQDAGFPVPHNLHLDGAPGGSFANQPPQLRAAAHADAVEFHDRITRFDAGLGRGAVLLDAVDKGPGDGRQFQFLRFFRGHIAQGDAQVRRRRHSEQRLALTSGGSGGSGGSGASGASSGGSGATCGAGGGFGAFCACKTPPPATNSAIANANPERNLRVTVCPLVSDLPLISFPAA